MNVLSHPPITSVSVEQTADNFPSAVFLIDYTTATVVNGSDPGVVTDIINSRVFPYDIASAGAAPTVDIQTADVAFTGDAIVAPGTKPFILFETAIPGAASTILGTIGSGDGGIQLSLSPILWDGTAQKSATTGFGPGTQMQTRLLAVDFDALTMTPYQYRPENAILPYSQLASTDLTGTVVSIDALTQSWSRAAGMGAGYCLGLMIFEVMPKPAAIKAAMIHHHHRAVDDGAVELPPTWRFR